MRNLNTGIHHIESRPLFLESSGCLVSPVVAVSRMSNFPALNLEPDVIAYMGDTPVGDVDVMAVPPEAAAMENRLMSHLSNTYLLGGGRGLDPDDCQSQVVWCQGAAFHEDACFNCVLAVMLWDGPPRDLVLPHLGVRVRLEPGMVALFDSAQPHGLLCSGDSVFSKEKFMEESSRSIFCTSDLARDMPGLSNLMMFETNPKSIPRDTFRIAAATRVDGATGAWLNVTNSKPTVT